MVCRRLAAMRRLVSSLPPHPFMRSNRLARNVHWPATFASNCHFQSLLGPVVRQSGHQETVQYALWHFDGTCICRWRIPAAMRDGGSIAIAPHVLPGYPLHFHNRGSEPYCKVVHASLIGRAANISEQGRKCDCMDALSNIMASNWPKSVASSQLSNLAAFDGNFASFTTFFRLCLRS